ncbi:hypothetical protein RDV84_05970 [Lysobacter yananisis]|uniref:Uncharacterized protein n=1 Tax=Lysobacter yananisis TaxID=1003114 RepID=A0ABY9PBW9_9GAMM|nr:hypothetical protein [Lysobacter yananisis]WMT04381.1 hypothetical protein RDV84_05970 [Lysobacter yananisis]
MTKLTLLAGLFVCGVLTAPDAVAGKDDIAGYSADRAELAASLPVRIVVRNSRVRPQIGLDHRPIAGEVPRPFQAGLSNAVLMAGGGLLPVLAAVAAERKLLRNRVEENFAVIQSAGCDLRIDESLPATVSAAVRRSRWGATTPIDAVVAEGRSLDKVVAEDRSRQVLSISSSLAPDMEALVTTLEIQAYAPTDGAPRWQREPVWRDELIVVSDVVEVASKTQADIDRLVAQEQARYKATGNAEAIGKLNAQRGGDRFERKRVLALQQEHERAMTDAQSSNWSAQDVKRQRATSWSENKCARMLTAVQQAGSDLEKMLDALYAQQLPQRLGSKDAPVSDDINGRHPHPLPGGAYVYRVDYDPVPLGYREDLLD